MKKNLLTILSIAFAWQANSQCVVENTGYTEEFNTYLTPCWTEAKGTLSATNTILSTEDSGWD